MPRLFIGILLPASIQPDLLVLLPDDARLKPARNGQLHLTLHFQGELSDESTSTLSQALAEVRCESFKLVLAGTGVFQQDGGSRGVLWVGVRPSESLQQLHAGVTRVVQHLGLPLEARTWTPHITLARYSGGPPEHLQRFLKRGDRLSFEFDVHDFQLVRSQPGPKGSVYTPLAVFPLR
jgi:2'-5' RNA ligase